MLKVKGVVCLKCRDFIFSRAGHDFHRCTCKAVAVDGGLDYVRVCGNGKDFNYIEVVLDVSPEELYVDWNEHQDKFGVIKNFKSVDMNKYHTILKKKKKKNLTGKPMKYMPYTK